MVKRFFLIVFSSIKYVRNWLSKINDAYLEVILSCLLPHPPEYARVGTCW